VLRAFLPRVILSLLFLGGAYFAFCESVYLRDQASEFGEAKIALWMWVFRGLAGGLILMVAFVIWFRR
jgi:hypothetical protein